MRTPTLVGSQSVCIINAMPASTPCWKAQANCNHSKHREQPDKAKQPTRTHALGQPPFNDYRMRNSPAVLPWAALFFFPCQQLSSPKVMKRICKSSKQTVIIQSTENNRTKSNSLHEHLHLDNHPSTIIAYETHLRCYHGQLCFFFHFSNFRRPR
jgi:hypothetical protein